MPARPQYPAAWANYSPHQKLRWRQANETNSTGFIGVRPEPSGKFGASIFDPSQEKRVWIGTFDTAEEAGREYEKAFIRIHGKEPEDEPDPDPNDLDGLRELVNQHYPPYHPMPFELSEMIRTEILPLLKDDP